VRATVETPRPDLRNKRDVRFETRRVWVNGRWNTAGSLIADYGSTTLVPQGWIVDTDEAGTLMLTRQTK
jgi:hypothetical protein